MRRKCSICWQSAHNRHSSYHNHEFKRRERDREKRGMGDGSLTHAIKEGKE